MSKPKLHSEDTRELENMPVGDKREEDAGLFGHKQTHCQHAVELDK
jgi:hypothetical protein